VGHAVESAGSSSALHDRARIALFPWVCAATLFMSELTARPLHVHVERLACLCARRGAAGLGGGGSSELHHVPIQI
jgi:hypothetical protein